MESEQQNTTTQETIAPVSGEQVSTADVVKPTESTAEEKPADTSTTEQQPPAEASTIETPAAASPAPVEPNIESEAIKPSVEEVEMTESVSEESAPVPAATEQDKSSVDTSAADTSVKAESQDKSTEQADESKDSALGEQMEVQESADKSTSEPAAVADELAANASIGGDKIADLLEKSVADDSKIETASAAASSADSKSQPTKKQKIDYASMAVRQYLDHTVVPILLAGLASVAKARPEDPIAYLANYLVENKTQYDNNQENSSLNGNQ